MGQIITQRPQPVQALESTTAGAPGLSALMALGTSGQAFTQ